MNHVGLLSNLRATRDLLLGHHLLEVAGLELRELSRLLSINFRALSSELCSVDLSHFIKSLEAHDSGELVHTPKLSEHHRGADVQPVGHGAGYCKEGLPASAVTVKFTCALSRVGNRIADETGGVGSHTRTDSKRKVIMDALDQRWRLTKEAVINRVHSLFNSNPVSQGRTRGVSGG